MTVNVVDGQLKVTLTETETARYNIDRVFFDRACDGAAKALSELLKTAAAKVNFTSAATRFAIELYPVFSGGCEVWYIPESVSNGRPMTTDRPVAKRRSVFEFDSSEGMMSVCELLYSSPKSRYLRSSLYKLGGRYRLLVTGLDTADFKKVCLGFADRVVVKPIDRVKTLEHWQCICPKNVIAIIGAAICERR